MQRFYVGPLDFLFFREPADKFNRSQYLYYLNEAKVLKIPPDSPIYNNFNYRYAAPDVGTRVASNVPKALFENADFVRAAIPAVTYVPEAP